MASRGTTFDQKWLLKDGNEKWLEKDSVESTSFYCKLCKKSYSVATSGYSAVTKHAAGSKHKKLLESATSSSQSRLDLWAPVNKQSSIDKSVSNKDEVTKAELRWLVFIVEHYLPFICANHTKVLAAMFRTCQIAAKMKCGATKMAYLANDALAPYLRKVIVQEINDDQCLYSISIDESNDFNAKYLQIMISFLSKLRNSLIVAPLRTISLPDGTSQTIELEVVKAMTESELSLASCVAISTDGPAAMVGRLNGFHERIRKHAPHLLDIGPCNLHVIGNAVKLGCENFDDCEDFMSDLFAYFHYTSRWTTYKEVSLVLLRT